MFPAAPGGRHHLSAAELRMSHDRPDFGERHSCDNNKVSPPEGGGADDMPPANGSSTVAYRFAANQAVCVSPWIQKSRRIYVRPQTGPQSAHLWWPAVAKLQATSVPIA